MRVITGIVSCAPRANHVAAIRDTYFRDLPEPFFFRGEPGSPSRREGDTLILDCADTYEHLPRKMFALYEYLLKHEDFDYFLKLDDDGYVHVESLRMFLERLRHDRPSLTHYMGTRILNPSVPRSNVWHVGKVSDPAFSEAYRGVFRHSYCGGGTGYILSRRAMEIIVERGRLIFLDPGEIYEDKCHGDVLGPNGILPTRIPAQIFVTDLSPDQIRARHESGPPPEDHRLYIGRSGAPIARWKALDGVGALSGVAVESVQYLCCEEVLERLSPIETWRFLRECHRVLKRGGALRISLTDLGRLIARATPSYLSSLERSGVGNKELGTAVVKGLEVGRFSAWSADSIEAMLRAIGFSVKRFHPGHSCDPELANLENRGLHVGEIENHTEVVCIEARKLRRLPAHRPRKVAFMFLTRGEPHQKILWEEFFAEHEHQFSMFTHAKYPHQVNSPLWRDTIIPEYVPTGWGRVSLVDATLRLLAEAIKDPSNEKFVLVSESCVPIKPFSRVYQELTKDRRGLLNWKAPAQDAAGEKGHRASKAIGLPRSFWRYHSQWFALNRESAQLLLDNNRVPHFDGVFAADECYVGSVLASLGCDFHHHFARKPLTHVKWVGGKAHPHRYDELTGDDFRALQSSKCLFARKFGENSNIRGLGLHLPLQ
jgi:hypothetical protein